MSGFGIGITVQPHFHRAMLMCFDEGNNKIGAKGCEFLKEGRWDRLQELYIGAQYMMQVETISEGKVASTCPKLIGLN